MANGYGYGGSTSSGGSMQTTQTVITPTTQRTSVPSSAVQRTVSSTGQVAPPGFHYMPDGTLMSDAEHATLYGSKTITSFDLDLSDLPASATRRNFVVSGDNGCAFSLEIRNEDDNYYNFTTESFQSTSTKLESKKLINGVYRGTILFPAITDDDHYDIYLYAEPGTKHVDYVDARFGDGSLDINSSIGSNSLLLQKIIYQYTDLTLTISTLSPSSTIETGSQSNAVLTIPRGQGKATTAFSVSCSTTSATKCYRIIKQPTTQDVLGYITMGIDGSPGTILPGEDIYPTVTNTDTVTNNVTSGVAVTMDSAVADKMAVGDRVTGNAALDAKIVTVASLDSTNVFSMSEAVAINAGVTLSFSNHVQHRWAVDNIVGIKEGMTSNILGTNITANSFVSRYQNTITLFENTENETVVVKNEAPFVNATGTPVYTNGILTTQAGEVVFDKQQKLVLGGDTLRMGGYGKDKIADATNYTVNITDLAIALTPISTTTTSGVDNSTSVPVAERRGILDSVSTVSGIGINPALADPTVSSGAGAVSGAGTIVLSAAQTLENGITLNFDGAGQTATITGNIEVISSGTSNNTIYFDVEKLLSIT